MPELRDIADNIIRPKDLIVTAVASKSQLQVGQVVDIIWRTEPFACWKATIHASPEKPFPQLKVQYPYNKRTVTVNGVSSNLVKIVQENAA